ncbi:MAG TPA: L,D-transpeptidase family protein [Rhodocyclaceae bacterium]
MTRRRLRPLALVAALGVALAVPAAGDRDSELRFADAGPEPLLAQVLHEVSRQRMDTALAAAEKLTAEYPTFRLGHLIVGDLLLARSRPLATFGNATGQDGRVAALREEARMRLAAYTEKPAAEQLPRQILQLSTNQRHAVLVDTSRSRLYLFANDAPVPRLVADYYVSQGRAGADKWREGDLKTPLGVYHVTSFLPPDSLTDFYGSGAFPINYPTHRDRRQGRTGHGIWLHGTPPDAYSRPPRASEGCVVLANPDFEALSASIDSGTTPVVIANGIDWLPAKIWQAERNSLREAIEIWRLDWESRDTDRYLSHYAADFRSDDQSRAAFAQSKRLINGGKAWIKVSLSNLNLLANPGEDDFVVANFEQDYRSNNLNNTMRKAQHWSRRNGRWQIIYEGSA